MALSVPERATRWVDVVSIGGLKPGDEHILAEAIPL
jgi:hypothetical protein